MGSLLLRFGTRHFSCLNVFLIRVKKAEARQRRTVGKFFSEIHPCEKFWLWRHVRPSVRPSTSADCRGGETGQPLGTGVFGQFSLAGNRVAVRCCIWHFLAGNHISDEQRDKEHEKNTREEATKFENFKRRNPREKPRKEKKRKFH